MTQNDRSEIRDMIHGILSGWQAATIAREDVTNNNLSKIDKHLEKLNGTIADHTRAISELKLKDDLHIVECPAMPKLVSIEKDLEEYHFVKKYPKLMVIIIAIFTIGIIISAIGAFNTLSNHSLAKKTLQQSEITNQILVPEAVERGFNLDSLGLNK